MRSTAAERRAVELRIRRLGTPEAPRALAVERTTPEPGASLGPQVSAGVHHQQEDVVREYGIHPQCFLFVSGTPPCSVSGPLRTVMDVGIPATSSGRGLHRRNGTRLATDAVSDHLACMDPPEPEGKASP